MIRLNFYLDNPFSKRWRTLWFPGGLIGQNWAWEFNVYRTHSLVIVDANIDVGGEYQGIFCMLGFLNYAIEFNVYNIHHAVRYHN
jgi:hypothetical protein